MFAQTENLSVEAIYMYEIKLEEYTLLMFSLVFSLFG
jgi:hypothetical protein